MLIRAVSFRAFLAPRIGGTLSGAMLRLLSRVASPRTMPSAAFVALLAFLAPLASLAAHPGHGEHSGAAFLTGLAHPVFGLDHLLAMAAVGLWAAQRGGRDLWLAPGSFLVCITLGGLAGFAGWRIPGVDLWIAVSMLAFGALIAAAVRLPAAAVIAVFGGFAGFHGLAHAAEFAGPAGGRGALEYATGFLLATAALHGIGIAAARALAGSAESPRSGLALRTLGALVLLCGAAFAGVSLVA